LLAFGDGGWLTDLIVRQTDEVRGLTSDAFRLLVACLAGVLTQNALPVNPVIPFRTFCAVVVSRTNLTVGIIAGEAVSLKQAVPILADSTNVVSKAGLAEFK